MQTQTTASRRPVRPTTPERWQAALKRALAAGVEVRQLAGSGAWVAGSATDPRAAYVVSGQACECRAAAEGDPVCVHRAAYWHAQGVLEVEPAAPVEPAPVPVATCPSCGGNGIAVECRGHRVSAGYYVHCPCATCSGAGTVTVAVVMAA